MRISITSKNVAVGPRLRFQAFDGVPPYLYELAPNGTAGGQITPSGDGGYYSSTKSGGVDIIIATDSNGETAQVEIFSGPPLRLICNLFRDQMKLDEDQVTFYNQKNFLKNDSRMYIMIGILTEKVMSNTYKDIWDESTQKMYRHQLTRMNAFIDVKTQSYLEQALDRRHDIHFVLTSYESEKSQFLNSYKLPRIPSSFSKIDYHEGNQLLYGFHTSFNVHYSVTKVTEIEYYDKMNKTEIVGNK